MRTPAEVGRLDKSSAREAERSPARFIVPVGRVLFAGIFLMSAVSHIPGGGVEYAAAQGVPLANVAVPLSGVMALLGGLSILLGYKARIGAWLIVMFLVPVTLMMHKFWAVADPAASAMEMSAFIKNTALIGAALMIVWFGAGPVSLDARAARGA